MKNRVARWLLIAWLAALVPSVLTVSAPAQTNSPAAPKARPSSGPAAGERNGCINNLKVLYDAIQAFKADHNRVPYWLSELVPQYISDANVLVCPVCRRTGQLESSPLADPKLPSSYIYEFCPVKLLGDQTRRDWKMLQLKKAGGVVPIVRCRHHKQSINLSWNGNIFECTGAWENTLSNRLDPEELKPEKLFAAEANPPPANKPSARSAPAANARPKWASVNLSRYFNASLTNHPPDGEFADVLSSLPAGRQKFGEVPFEIRGLIQLGGQAPAGTNFPAHVRNIRLHRYCRKIHFLQAAASGGVADEGRKIGSYTVYYSTNQMRLEIPIYYGRNVRNVHPVPDEPPAPEGLTPAFIGGADNRPVRLFSTTWENVAPGVEIDHLDFTSVTNGPAPLLIAITTE